MTAAQIAQVEELVNQEILANAPTQARLLPIEEAKKTGAMMLFGEKYGDEVRVLDIGSSRELCGGTHVHATGDIGLFKITSEGGVAAGVRRVEAVTGMNALAYVQTQVAALDAVASALRAPVSEVTQRLLLLQEQVRASEKEVARLKAKLAASAGDDLLNKVSLVAGVKLLAAAIEGGDAKSLRDTVDQLKNKLGSGVVLLASQVDGKVSLCAGVTADLLGKYKAGELVSLAAAACGGKGGGRPDMAMAGGTQVDKIDDALACAALYLSR
jgi:alanyl-tRNA synthetase